MFANLFRRSTASDVPQELYGSVVAQARQPVFFTDYGFQDTVTGRYDVVALHLFLFSRRMVREDTNISQSLNQEVFDRFTDETDRALRELGVGDTSVPKRKKRMIHSFYAIVEEFSAPLDAQDHEGLAAVIAKRFATPSDEESDSAAIDFNTDSLSAYVLAASAELDKIPFDDLAKGKLTWPDPTGF